MSLHPIILRVALGIAGLLTVNTTVEAAVVSLKAVKKNNVGITPTNSLTVRGGDTIEADIFLSGWGAELPNGVRFFQIKLDRTGFISADNGTALPLGWCAPLSRIECTDSAMCPAAYPICAPPSGCTCAGHDPTLGAFMTRLRTDFLLHGLDGFFAIDTHTLSFRYFGLATDSVAVPDTGVPRYLGTLILKVSANACGTFTIGFVEDFVSTFISDPSSPPNMVLPTSQPLVLTVSECCRVEFPCSPAHCNIDARIAHDRNDMNAKRTTNRIQMAFCESTADMTLEDFEVTIVPPGGIIPGISSVTPVVGNPNRTTVFLNRRIQEARWTCVRHIESNRQCCMGSLPGDANGNRVRELADAFEVYDNLQGGVIPPLAIEKCDVDRSLLCTPADLLMIVDLLLCEFTDDCDAWLPICPPYLPP